MKSWNSPNARRIIQIAAALIEMTPSISFSGLIVLVADNDNKLRLVPLTQKQSARVRRLVTQLHGGSLHVCTKDLLVMSESDAIEAFGRLTGKVPIRQRFARLGNRLFKRELTRPENTVPSTVNLEQKVDHHL